MNRTMSEAARKTAKKTRLTITIAFGGSVNLNGTSIRLPVSMQRADLNPASAGVMVCSRALVGEIVARPPGVEPGEKLLIDDGDSTIRSVFEILDLSVRSERISFVLSFTVADVDLAALSHVVGCKGTMTFEASDA